MRRLLVLFFICYFGHLQAQRDSKVTERELKKAEKVLIEKRHFERAQRLFQSLLEKDSLNPRVINGLGITVYHLEGPAKAIPLYNKAIEIDPDYFVPYENRANARCDLGEFDKALADLNLVIDSAPTITISAFINRGRVYRAMQRWREAVKDYTLAMLLGYNGPDALSGRGLTYFNMGNLDSARADLNQVLQLYPKDPNAHANYAMFLCKGMNNNFLAALYGEKAIELGLKDFNHYHHMSYYYYRSGQWNKAVHYYSKRISANKVDMDDFFGRGSAYAMLGNYEAALADFSMALSVDSAHVNVFTNRALLIYDKQDRIEEAITDINTAIEIQKRKGENLAFSLNNLGYLEYRAGRFETALDLVWQSLQLEPGNSFAFRNLCLIHIKQGKYTEACDAAQKAIDLGFEKMYGSEIIGIQAEACKQR